MSAYAPMPTKDSSSQPPQQEEGLDSISSQPQEAPTTNAPDPKEILKTKLNIFRGLDEQITAISRQSDTGGKFGAMVKNLLKAWMMDEVKNTRESMPRENPRIPGAS